jgi:hypothetical protein
MRAGRALTVLRHPFLPQTSCAQRSSNQTNEHKIQKRKKYSAFAIHFDQQSNILHFTEIKAGRYIEATRAKR